MHMQELQSNELYVYQDEVVELLRVLLGTSFGTTETCLKLSTGNVETEVEIGREVPKMTHDKCIH